MSCVCQKASFSLVDMKECSFTVAELRAVDFSPRELLEAGFSRELLDVFSAQELKVL